MFKLRMQEKKKNLGGLDFLLPSKTIETVKEVQENENGQSEINNQKMMNPESKGNSIMDTN